MASEHREIEAALELLAADPVDPDAFRRARDLCREHYRQEEAFLMRLAGSNRALAAKLRAQHEEALEIAEKFEGSSDADARYLARRFMAIVQHNIIEEERDVFPIYGPQ